MVFLGGLVGLYLHYGTLSYSLLSVLTVADPLPFAVVLTLFAAALSKSAQFGLRL